MYVGNFEENIQDSQASEEKIDRFFSHTKKAAKKIAAPEEEKLITEHSADVLAHWRAPEFEVYEQNKRSFLYVTLLFIALIAYALYADSPIMAITFVLFGVVGYIHMNKDPRVLDFMVTYDGIVAGNEIFKYEAIKSFWIFYEADGLKVISLHTDSYLTPYVHIPIHNEDPVRIRGLLLGHLEEIKQEPNIADVFERFLHM
ncbi:MAG: hypothetical protein WC120_05580 [Parcubacteria group bacterium]